MSNQTLPTSEPKRTITIQVEGGPVTLDISSILYVEMEENYANVHLSKDEVYRTRITMIKLAPRLGDGFIFVRHGCLVSVIAIYCITDKVYLVNGESLDYARYNRTAIRREYAEKKGQILRGLAGQTEPERDYLAHYRVFDTLPIAFADIEMVFDEEDNAIDWIFCYGNPALAELEQVDLDRLLGNTFSSVFPDMDRKWLRSYERAVLFGETLNIVDYSPEIDTKLNILCFPTFTGHCGCILMDIDKMHFFRAATSTENAIATYVTKLLG